MFTIQISRESLHDNKETIPLCDVSAAELVEVDGIVMEASVTNEEVISFWRISQLCCEWLRGCISCYLSHISILFSLASWLPIWGLAMNIPTHVFGMVGLVTMLTPHLLVISKSYFWILSLILFCCLKQIHGLLFKWMSPVLERTSLSSLFLLVKFQQTPLSS